MVYRYHPTMDRNANICWSELRPPPPPRTCGDAVTIGLKVGRDQCATPPVTKATKEYNPIPQCLVTLLSVSISSDDVSAILDDSAGFYRAHLVNNTVLLNALKYCPFE